MGSYNRQGVDAFRECVLDDNAFRTLVTLCFLQQIGAASPYRHVPTRYRHLEDLYRAGRRLIDAFLEDGQVQLAPAVVDIDVYRQPAYVFSGTLAWLS